MSTISILRSRRVRNTGFSYRFTTAGRRGVWTLLLFVGVLAARAQVFNGNLTLINQAQVDAFNYTEVTGFLSISGSSITNLDGLAGLSSVGSSLGISNNGSLTSLSGLDQLSSVGGGLQISNNGSLTSLSGLDQLSSVGGYLYIATNGSLTSLSGLDQLSSVGGNLRIQHNDNLTSLSGLDQLSSVGGYLHIFSNGSLTSVSGLDQLSSVSGNLVIEYNDNLTSVSGLDQLSSVGSYLVIRDNGSLTSVSGLDQLSSVGGNLEIFSNGSLTSVSGLDQLSSVGNILYIADNPLLSDCCGILPLLETPGAVGGIIIISNNLTGCDSPSEVTEVCNEPPLAVCRAVVVAADADCQATVPAEAFDGGSSDPNDDLLTFSVDVPGPYPLGATDIVLTVSDGELSSEPCFTTITVEDNIDPTVLCRNITVQLDANAQASITTAQVNKGSNDNCGIASLSLGETSFSCADIGSNPVILTATDLSGNIARCTTSVQVNGLPCGFIDPGGIGCSSQAGYDPATGTFSIQTDDCNSGSPYHDELGAIAYQLCGNGSISFRLASLSSQNAFAGIFLRTGPQPNAVKAEVVTNRYFTARGVVREYAGAAAWPLPFYLYGRHWLKLERLGNQVRVYTSPDGQTWTILLARNLSLPNCVYVGMMAYGPGAVTATFDDVKVNGSPLQTGPLQTSPEGGGFPLEEAFLKPSTVHRLLSTVLPTSDFPLPTSKPSTGPLQTSPEGRGFPLEENSSPPSTVYRQPSTVLKVYPNPTEGRLIIDLPQDLDLEHAELQVIDLYGRVLLERRPLDYRQELDLSGRPAGTYFVRLQTADRSVWTERVVVRD